MEISTIIIPNCLLTFVKIKGILFLISVLISISTYTTVHPAVCPSVCQKSVPHEISRYLQNDMRKDVTYLDLKSHSN